VVTQSDMTYYIWYLMSCLACYWWNRDVSKRNVTYLFLNYSILRILCKMHECVVITILGLKNAVTNGRKLKVVGCQHLTCKETTSREMKCEVVCPSLCLLHLISSITLSLPYVPRHRGAGANCGLRTSVVLTGTPVIVVRSTWHHMCWTFIWCYHLFAWRCSKLQLGSQSELTVACACMFGLYKYCLYSTCKHSRVSKL